MPPLLIAAGIAGVATVAGAAISSKATNKATQAATTAAADNNALQERIYNSNVGLSQPYINRGNQASDLISSFLGINGDPAKAKAALDTYLNGTGYQFRVNEGVRAITGNRAASGLLESGATLKALDEFGQNSAKAGANDWLSSLFAVSNQGVNAIGAATGAGTHYADATSTNNTTAADATGNAALVGAANTNNLIRSLAGTGINLLGQSSYGTSSGGGTGGISVAPATGAAGTAWNPLPAGY